MPERSKDWINQAIRDFEVAKSLKESGSYEWACFAAHQAAEKAVKAARNLDRHYVPTRYPDSFDSGSPYEYFTEEDAENAILCCRRILEFCKGLLAQS